MCSNFSQPVGKRVDIFALDERGALFTQTLPFHNHHVLVDHLARFFRSVALSFQRQRWSQLDG